MSYKVIRSPKLTLLLAALSLSACVGSTPSQQYFELKQHYDVALTYMAGYRQECDKQPSADPCKAIVTHMQKLDAAASLAFEQADKVFIPASSTDASQDASYKELAFQNAKVALANIESYILQVKN